MQLKPNVKYYRIHSFIKYMFSAPTMYGEKKANKTHSMETVTINQKEISKHPKEKNKQH